MTMSAAKRTAKISRPTLCIAPNATGPTSVVVGIEDWVLSYSSKSIYPISGKASAVNANGNGKVVLVNSIFFYKNSIS